MNGNGGGGVTSGSGYPAAEACSCPVLDSPAVATAGPNVLLVVLDTARADHLGPRGGPPTPTFDALAAGGTTATAFSTSPWTVPSHASMFSGLLPFEHGVTGSAAITRDRRLASLAGAIAPHRERWLPEVFRRAGYRTAAVSANVWITPTMGFDLGFEGFTAVGMARLTPRGGEHRWRPRDAVPEPVRRRAKRLVRYLRDARKGRDFGGREAVREVRSLVTDPDERPLFLFVNVMECHAPYLPPDPYNPLIGRRRLRGPAVNHRYLGDAFVGAYSLGAVDVPEEDLAILRALYAGEVAYADRVLGGIVEALGPALEQTIVAVTADHGENLGEDHRLGHVLSLDEQLLSVPLALAGPGVPDLSGITSLRDLPGVLCRAAGLGGHPYDARSEGVAIAQYESGWNHLRRAPDVLRRYRLSSEQEAVLRGPMSAATDGRTLLVRRADGERIEGPDDGAGALRRALDAVGGEPAAPEGYSPLEEAEIEERLRDLGYL
jgi:arylsulfatase A-like enzyme